VAAYRLGFTRVPAPYGDAAADDALASDVAAGQEPAAGRMSEYLQARTRFFDRVVTGAIDRGVRQIVVGAAGYDGRAFRYARSGVRWFEVDHPATQRDKRERLARLGLDAGQVRFVEADFTRDPIAERLLPAGLLTAIAAPTVTPARKPRPPQQAEPPRGPLSLSALLSQALVAFTIELDNEAEHRLPHRTTNHDGAVLRATARGLRARQIWLPLPAAIEQRWTERFGAAPVGQLRQALLAAAGQLDPGLPDTLPILGQVLFSRGPDPALPPRPEPSELATLPLSGLLSRVLLAFALDYEASSEVSLAVGANLLRVLREDGLRPRDLPAMTGISKEAVAWALGVLLRARLAVEEPDPAASRGKVARLTPRGLLAQGLYLDQLGAVEDRWRDRFGADTIAALRQPLEALAVGPEGQPPPLFQGLEPYPDNWRASVRPPRTLPYYPMVLHRGGYPDGS